MRFSMLLIPCGAMPSVLKRKVISSCVWPLASVLSSSISYLSISSADLSRMACGNLRRTELFPGSTTLNGFLKFRNAVAAFEDVSGQMVILDEVAHAVWFLFYRKHENLNVRSIPKNFY